MTNTPRDPLIYLNGFDDPSTATSSMYAVSHPIPYQQRLDVLEKRSGDNYFLIKVGVSQAQSREQRVPSGAGSSV
jgi:hypothetical protein